MGFPKSNYMDCTNLPHRASALLFSERAKSQHAAYLLFAMPFSTLPSVGVGQLFDLFNQSHFLAPMYSEVTSIRRCPSSLDITSLAARSAALSMILAPRHGALHPVRLK